MTRHGHGSPTQTIDVDSTHITTPRTPDERWAAATVCDSYTWLADTHHVDRRTWLQDILAALGLDDIAKVKP